VKVPADSMEAIEWPTVAQYRSERTKKKKQIEPIAKAVEKAVTDALTSPGVTNAGRQAGTRVAAAGARAAAGVRAALSVGTGGAAAGLATLGVAGSAAAVAAAFGVGYGLGKLALKAVEYMSPEMRQQRRNQDLVKARKQYEAKVGRPVNRAEAKAMAQGWAQASGVTL
jgi:hypothetical protein